MYLIAGLGNPDLKYAATRHNVGFEAAARLRDMKSFSTEHLKFHAMCSQGIIGSEKVLLIRPMTYMNLSGRAVREAMDFYKIEPDHLIVVYDDVDLPFGALRVRSKGSAGGHNGMKNIIQEIGSDAFARVRIGVGAKPDGWDLADYVLSHFTKEEIEIIRPVIESAAEACCLIVTDGAGKAMNVYNTRKSTEKPNE
ncbi:MAG: aminoacyl-tRNA hydrolase [Firmicutes bacterium]|nr:aminoacyl-tRNA hydrolase [Bacillota bacterium]